MIAPAQDRAARTLALAACLGLSACSGSFDERAHEAFHQAIAAGQSSIVQVDNVAGSVRIDGWTKPFVDVEATKYAQNPDGLRNITIAVHEEGGRIFIATKYAGVMNHGGVRYRISVPSGVAIQVDNAAGMVDVAGVFGDINVSTQAGEITADAGRVTGNRSIHLSATTGALKLSIAPKSDANIEAHSVVGAFSTDVPGVSQTRENLVGVSGSGKIGSGSARIQLTTTTGAIDLRLRPQ